ncbi:POTRA domain-containing protein [Aurantibacter sp.]|uniref:POTRA domain-containing protein n=1 Tax=Aurantibacter sp. TaxID=2807103 RepID=UPI003265C2B5
MSLTICAQTYIADVVFEGTKRTKPSFLKNLIKTTPGSVLDSTQIENDVQYLKRLPSISNADFELSYDSEKSAKVLFTIIENYTLIPFASIYTSSNDEFAFRIGLQEFNFLGRNITLGAFYQYDVFNSYGLQVKAPYLLGRKWGLSLDYHDLKTLEPIFFDDTAADYSYNNKAIELLALHQINFRNQLSFGGGFFTENYEYISGATSVDVPRALKIDKALFKLIHQYDGVDYDYQLLNGFRNTFNFQYVKAIKTDFPSFVIAFNDLIYYRELWHKGVWANRLRMGLSSNEKTPFAPFSVDNNINIRGVGNTIDRGTGTVVLNTEYRHNFIDKDWFILQGNFFIDAGTWRNPGGNFDDFTHEDNIRVYPGLGLRFVHKRIFNAVFRIDYGHGITKGASRGIVFGIGQYF